jgi:thiol-disulfide isomerase/thioredoxin
MSTMPRGRGRARTWLYIALTLAAVWALCLAFFLPGPPREGDLPPPELKLPDPPRTADYGWLLRDLDGAPVSLEKYRGRAVFLNRWATWCPPCLDELPSIANLADNRRLKNVAFLCVSNDESPDALRQFVKGKSWPMTVLRTTEEPSAAFSCDGLPTTFVIAPDGRIVAIESGPAQWDDPSAVDFLEQLAASAADPEHPEKRQPDPR